MVVVGVLKMHKNTKTSSRCLDFTHLIWSLQEEGVGASQDGCAGHQPNEHLHRFRHDCRDLVGEKQGERRCQHPESHLQPPSVGGPWRRSLEPAQAEEKDEEVHVRGRHKGDCTHVAVRPVDGHGRVEGEEDEPHSRQPREAAAADDSAMTEQGI